jgi:type IV pilus assembly protein PilW
MDMIGRDLENAGFYPSNFSPALQGSTVQVLGYQSPCVNPKDAAVSLCGFTAPAAFSTAVFGCSAKRLLRTGSGSSVAYACGNLPTGVTSTDADTLVVNYYTSDSLGLNIGQRGDCEGQDVAKDAINTRDSAIPSATLPNRLTYSAALPSPIAATNAPVLPLFVSNRYTLSPVTESIEGRNVSSYSLACDGNGNDNELSKVAASIAQPMMTGLGQLRFKYLQRDPSTTEAQYLNASAVTNWSNVQAVRVCVVARANSTANLASYTMKDCDGADKTYSDGIQRQIFTQVFALKNRLP